MMKRVYAAVLLAMFTLGAAAQTAGEQALRDAVVNKQHFLRDFSGEREVRLRWDNDRLIRDEPRYRTWGVWTGESVEIQGSNVIIEAERQTLLESAGKYGVSPAKTRVKIVIDLAGADMALVLPQLPSLLFYPNMQAALADTTHRPASVGKRCCDEETDPKLKHCDCAHPSKALCGTDSPDMGMIGAEAPKIISSKPTEITDEIRKARSGGGVQVLMTFGITGLPSDIWVTRSLGPGFDEAAALTVASYKAKPATCHGEPIPMDFEMNILFNVRH